MDKARKLTKVAAESQGMAELKYQAYMESSEAATKRLQNAWEGLTNSFQTSTFLADVKNAISWVIEHLTQIASTIGSIFLSIKSMRTVTGLINSAGTNGGLFPAIGQSIKAKWNRAQDYMISGEEFNLKSYLPRYGKSLDEIVALVKTISEKQSTHSTKTASTIGAVGAGAKEAITAEYNGKTVYQRENGE